MESNADSDGLQNKKVLPDVSAPAPALWHHVFCSHPRYFAGVLPGESTRAIIARSLCISERNDYELLERIGGECASAISFLPVGESVAAREAQYWVLS